MGNGPGVPGSRDPHPRVGHRAERPFRRCRQTGGEVLDDPVHVVLAARRIEHTQAHRVPTGEPRARHQRSANALELLDQAQSELLDLGLAPTRQLPPETHDAETHRGHQRERRMVAHQPFGQLGQSQVPFDGLSACRQTERLDRHPHLQGTEAPRQRQAAIGRVDLGLAVRVAVVEVVRVDGGRALRAPPSRTSPQAHSMGWKSHLCGSSVTESARSMPAGDDRPASPSTAIPP